MSVPVQELNENSKFQNVASPLTAVFESVFGIVSAYTNGARVYSVARLEFAVNAVLWP